MEAEFKTKLKIEVKLENKTTFLIPNQKLYDVLDANKTAVYVLDLGNKTYLKRNTLLNEHNLHIEITPFSGIAELYVNPGYQPQQFLDSKIVIKDFLHMEAVL